jgi:hypothetical protein
LISNLGNSRVAACSDAYRINLNIVEHEENITF